MKLWLKLTILLTIIINIVIEIGMFTLTPKIESFAVNLLGDKLKSIAASIAAGIDGDQFVKINIYDSTAVTNPIYNHIQKTIETTKVNLELTNDLYAISILDNNSISFGVVLNKTSFGRDTLRQLSEIGKTAAYDVYEKKECVYTNLYEDRYGNWLSGFAPIFDSNKKVVGIIKLDQRYSAIYEKLNEINDQIFIGRIILIPVTILLSFILANVFMIPINRVKQSILKIASGNYSENEPVKSGGEIKELINASETLRKTLFEQQQKIFETIKDLETAKLKAESSDRMKSEFLAVLSHEIRTPLNVILGNIEVMKLELDERVLEELKEITEEIKFGSNRLIRTVEMIVLYSELASGSYNKKERFLNVNPIFFATADLFRNDAAIKGIDFKTDCSATTGMIKADESLLEESIKQIADNAVKFSNSGEITFCIMDKKDAGICLLVQDNGIGISPEFMKEIFKPFRQEDMTYSRKFEGNGLGLALVKKCCDANGFDLKISSEKNKGTTVEIHIPKEKLFDI